MAAELHSIYSDNKFDMAICNDGQHGSYMLWERFHDSNGNLLPDVASGYFSRLYQFDDSKPLAALSIREMWQKACWCGTPTLATMRIQNYPPAGCNSNYRSYREWFCNNLYDAGGNKVTNPPPICGGTGPEVLLYNPNIGALQNLQDDAAALMQQYADATSGSVGKIIKVGSAIAVLIIIIALIWLML